MYIPKNAIKHGFTSTYQFLIFKLYRKRGKDSCDWAHRIVTVTNDNMHLDCEDPWKSREFLVCVWNCLVTLAKEEQDDERIEEYKKARTFTNVGL